MGRTSSTVSGAAQGAQAGSAFGPYGTAIGAVVGGASGFFGSGGGGGGPKNPAGKIADKVIKRAFGKKKHQKLAAQYIRNRLPLSAGEQGALDVYNQMLAPELAGTTQRLFDTRDKYQPMLDRIASGETIMPDVDPYVKLAQRTYQNMVAPQLAGQFAQDNAFFSDLHGNTSRRAAQDMSTELGARALDLAPQHTANVYSAIQGMPAWQTEPFAQGTGLLGNVMQTGLAGRTLQEGTRMGAQPLVPSVFDAGGSFTGLANIPRLYDTPKSSGSGGGGLLGGGGGLFG